MDADSCGGGERGSRREGRDELPCACGCGGDWGSLASLPVSEPPPARRGGKGSRRTRFAGGSPCADRGCTAVSAGEVAQEAGGCVVSEDGGIRNPLVAAGPCPSPSSTDLMHKSGGFLVPG
ncbi:hypothetical protein AV530_007924 [Patagioenas fasciata monilis]|uniref:Uncharacterized protein n=1 Tax=Patagioenas fasciata monilis TaxID=372326 RepID=A0A1V4JH40_PATFA|nr:hypothetical protein AV530_007924 [Patagioenas fasciata monilis]